MRSISRGMSSDEKAPDLSTSNSTFITHGSGVRIPGKWSRTSKCPAFWMVRRSKVVSGQQKVTPHLGDHGGDTDRSHPRSGEQCSLVCGAVLEDFTHHAGHMVLPDGTKEPLAYAVEGMAKHEIRQCGPALSWSVLVSSGRRTATIWKYGWPSPARK
jgi:hypothetical protein